jgi:predicted ABC-type ATPase
LTLPEWQRYAWVAERLALDPQPKLIIMHGLSGSGKSTVAQRLVAEQRGLRIRSDRLRQLLPADNDRADRYAATSRDRVYEELAAVVERANRAIRQIFETEKYDIILQEVVFAGPRVDITDKVIRALAGPVR